MADTVRTQAALLALMPPGIRGAVSAQDIRDFLVSVYAVAGLGSGAGFATLTDLSATPSVAAGLRFKASNSAPTTITNLTGGFDGQDIVIVFTNANTTIQHNANIRLQGGIDFVGGIDDTLRLSYDGTKWRQDGRSLNS